MNSITDSEGRELQRHGTYDFPCSAYHATGGGCQWHWHDEMEMLYVESGTLVYAVENRRYVLCAGDGIIVNRDVPHAVELYEMRDYSESDIVFQPRLLYGSVDTVLWDKYFRRFLQDASLPGYPLYGANEWQAEAAQGILRACQAFMAKKPMYEFAVREELTKTYLAVWEHTNGMPDSGQVHNIKRDNRVKSMMRYLEEHIDVDVSLDDLAAYAGISARACQREFQAYLGMTSSQYLSRTRLNRAAYLLRAGELSVTEIVYQCGFHDGSYFAKQFRLRYGMTPREYQLKA